MHCLLFTNVFMGGTIIICPLHVPGGDGWSVAQQRNGEQQQTSKGVLQSPGLYRSRDSVATEESASSSSVEDLKPGKETDTLRQETPSLEMRMSDECYANPVDAINEFLQGRDAEFSSLTEIEPNESPKSIVPHVETESTTQLLILKSLGEEPSLQAQQTSKEMQLQLFHERLFKDHTSSCDHQTPSNGSSEVDTDSIHNRPHDYSEIDEEPTYSNPFDALAESAYRPPYRVKIDKLKRNVSMSASAIQLPKQQSSGSSTRCSNSPPPPPVPIKDEKKIVGGLNHRQMCYGRCGSGENEPRGAHSIARSGSSASVSSIPQQQQQQQQRVWERREPVWKRNNSRRGSDDGAFLPQRSAADHEDKPEAPLSVAERLRQLRQRSQSDGLTVDEARLQSRPPMPLPIEELERSGGGGWGQVRLNGQSHHMSHAAASNGREEERGGKPRPARQKAWLERTVSDQHQSVYFARPGMAHVVPLSAREIVKQHISHAAS